MKQVSSARILIVKQYKKATYSYLLPPAFLLFGVLWEPLLLLGLLTVLPCSIIGLYYTYNGLKLASSQGDLEKKDVGYANILLGVVLFVFGLLSAGFAYVSAS